MIRQAKPADFEAIAKLRECLAFDTSKLGETEYRLRIQREGFLLPIPLDPEDYARDLPNYYVAEQAGEVLGYFSLGDKQSIPKGKKIAWYLPDMEALYWDRPHLYLAAIGVLPQAKQRGLGTDMLKAVEELIRARGIDWLFSFVLLTPVTNFASMMFHEKNGFERAAILGPDEFSGKNGFHLDLFQSFLYVKQL